MKQEFSNSELKINSFLSRFTMIHALIGLFTLINLIPLIGPAILGFMLGTSSSYHKNNFNLSSNLHYRAMFSGTCLTYGIIDILLQNKTILTQSSIIIAILINFVIAKLSFDFGAEYYMDSE